MKYYEDDIVTLYNGDCVEVMSEMEARSFVFIENCGNGFVPFNCVLWSCTVYYTIFSTVQADISLVGNRNCFFKQTFKISCIRGCFRVKLVIV